VIKVECDGERANRREVMMSRIIQGKKLLPRVL
jgi:hypothetical protein